MMIRFQADNDLDERISLFITSEILAEGLT
jgi:hypothetical protein